MVSKFQNDLMNYSELSVALEHSTQHILYNTLHKPQLAAFTRYITNNLKGKEELLKYIALKNTTQV